MQKRLLRIGVAVATVAAVAFLIMRMAQNKVLVANESGQEVRTLIVAAPGVAPATFHNIPPGSTRTFRFLSKGEGGISLHATLADGTVLTGEDGYVTRHLYTGTMRFAIPATGRILFNGHPAYWPGGPTECAAREQRHERALKGLQMGSRKMAELATRPAPQFPQVTTSPWASTLPAAGALQP